MIVTPFGRSFSKPCLLNDRLFQIKKTLGRANNNYGGTHCSTYLPENTTVACFGYIGENRVLLNSFHGNGIRFVIGACIVINNNNNLKF